MQSGFSALTICCYMVRQQFCPRNVNVIKGESAAHEICAQTVYVSDLGQALDFYTQALGYKVKARYGSCVAQLSAGCKTRHSRNGSWSSESRPSMYSA